MLHWLERNGNTTSPSSNPCSSSWLLSAIESIRESRAIFQFSQFTFGLISKMAAIVQDDFDSEYAVHILKTISESEDLREIKLVAELDEQK